MWRAGRVSRASSVCRGLAITWKNISLASRDPTIAVPGSRPDRLKISRNRVLPGQPG